MSDTSSQPKTAASRESDNDRRSGINEKEQETLAFWNEHKIFEKSVLTPAGEKPKGSFSFYDGPPFATGLPHHGHILAGTIKDAIPRYQTMRGNTVRRIWGWDCHGLPIENLIEKKLGLESKKDIETFGIDKFNHDAFCSVLQYEDEWKKVIPRLGRFVNMDHPYKTMDTTYTESIWWAWKTLYEKGLAYEGYKMMHICPRCETPLAQSEVGLEYHDVTDVSVTAKFELIDPTPPEGFAGQVDPKTYVLAWTTTPWTLPGNTALAVNKNATYVKVSIEGMEGEYILAKKRIEDILHATPYTLHAEFSGDKLVGKSYKPLFPYFVGVNLEHKENIWKIWHADFITDQDGTGIAHEAPAFGADDMELAKVNNIPVIKHVKMDGTFTDDVTDFAGMKVKKKDDTQSADIEIIKWLAHHDLLFEKHKIVHSYPLCWRCKTPLLNYATSSWFVDVPKIKNKLITENSHIGWTPEHIRDGRFGKWLEGAREWAVSRSRYWGAPLPVWKNASGDVKMIGSLKELAELTTQKPKNTYYVMRHGESESNVSGVIDSDGEMTNHLTEKGKEEVSASASALKDKHIDLIIVSPFARAKETANIVSDVLGGIDIVEDTRVREINLGIYNGRTIDDYLKEVGKLEYLRLDTRVTDGESHRDVMNRMMQMFADSEARYEGKTILVITHGGPARMFIAGAELMTEEEVLLDEAREHPALYLLTAETRQVAPSLVPRDITGAVNLHRPYIDDVKLSIDGVLYTRIGDVFDCWFESGAMSFASLHYPFENKNIFDTTYPADFIAEGLDQTRGWFYSLINLGVGLFDIAPYKHVIVNGLVLAESGVKLSKSEKNYTDPIELVERYGADAMRYFLLSSPAVKGENVQFSDKSIEEVYKRIIMRLENVVSLYEMNKPTSVRVSDSSANVLDMWIVSRLHEIVASATHGYDTYMLDEATSPIDQFVDDLSVWYVRRSRDRLKGDLGDDNQTRAYETLAYVIITLSKIIAPVMPFLAERLYKVVGGERESVHLESWPIATTIDTDVLEEMKKVRVIVTSALALRTEAKIPVRQPLRSITIKDELPSLYHELILDELNVKDMKYDPALSSLCTLDTVIDHELQEEGDVRQFMRAVQDERKKLGLTPKDKVVLATTYAIPSALLADVIKTCNLKEVVKDDTVTTNGVALSSGTVYFVVR